MYWCVPVCAGVGSGGKFRRVPVCAGVGSGGKFRSVPVCAGVGSGGKFQKVPCWCRFRRQVLEGSGGWCRFRSQVPESFSGRFWKVLEGSAGVGSGSRFREVPAGSGGFWCVLA